MCVHRCVPSLKLFIVGHVLLYHTVVTSLKGKKGRCPPPEKLLLNINMQVVVDHVFKRLTQQQSRCPFPFERKYHCGNL